MSALQVAAEHQRSRARLADKLRAEARAAWAAVNPAHISQTWALQIPRLLLLLTGGQHAAAVSADRYVTEALVEQGINPTTQGRLDAAALSGIASDGRSLESLLAQPGIVTKVALASGETLERAMVAGGVLAELIGHTQVADAGRVADGVSLASRPHATGFTRMVVGATCSRCIILAGRWYRWNAGFDRHPKCDCVGIPAAESAHELRTDPRKTFDSMSAAEQDKVFTAAGAQAIRDGADMAKVVNARRGMQTASVLGREVQVTTEGTARGRAGVLVGGRRVRLMPEAILAESKGDRSEAIRLLRLHGYIL